jgi:hypothetical protein
MIFGAIILTSLVREMLEMHRNISYIHVPAVGSSRPQDTPISPRFLAPPQNHPQDRQDKPQTKSYKDESFKKISADFFEVHVNQISKYEKLLPLRSNSLTPFIEFRKTGYYTVKLVGEDLAKSAPGRKDTSITLHECVYESTLIKCNNDIWNWDSVIEFTYVDVFLTPGSMLALVYNAPRGFITYIGMNNTVQVRDQIISMELLFANA